MMEHTYDIVVSDAALAMLDSHADFLARVSPGAALRLIDEILSDIASLSENPQRFPIYENRFVSGDYYRRMLSAKRYLIIYEITEETVFVDYVIDCRQDYDWLIR